MRHIVALLIVALALPASAQMAAVDTTTTAGKALWDAYMAERYVVAAAASQVHVDRIDSTATANGWSFATIGGVTVLPDSLDQPPSSASWVQLRFDGLASATGLQRSFIVNAVVEAKQSYGAKDRVPGQVRMSWSQARDFLEALDATLK